MENQIQAVIFDLDGTILEDEDQYGRAFKKVLVSLGAVIPEECPHVTGIGVKENWPGLLTKYKIKTNKSLDELAAETQKAFLEELPSVTLKPGFKEFVFNLKQDGVKTALATANTWNVVEKVIENFDLNNFFDSITTVEEVKFNKPEPDLFLLASEKLGVDPKNCIVFEDSPAGIEAAHAAGMQVFGVARNEKQASELEKANKVISSFEEVI